MLESSICSIRFSSPFLHLSCHFLSTYYIYTLWQMLEGFPACAHLHTVKVVYGQMVLMSSLFDWVDAAWRTSPPSLLSCLYVVFLFPQHHLALLKR